MGEAGYLGALMKKIYIAAALTLLTCLHILAQEPVRYFEIKTPPHKKNKPAYNKVQYSLYNQIGFLDSRDDSELIGKVNTGLLRHEATLKLKTPFQPQLRVLLDSLTDSTAANGELLFQLRQFRFIEESGSRYCYLQAGLYVKMDDEFYRLAILDSVMLITASDVLGVVQGYGNQVLADFIAMELTRKPDDPTLYHIQDIYRYDSIEKSKIPVFASTSFVNGIYNKYASFKDQNPDRQGYVTTEKDGSISKVEVDDPVKGKRVKLKPGSIYALVFKGKAYIATEYGYYPVERVGSNLYFTADVRVAASEGDKAGAQIAFGLVGRALASSGYKGRYEMIIDPVSGTLEHLHKIEIDPQQ